MFTFSFFVRLFASGLFSAWLFSFCSENFCLEETLAEKIAYWILTILFYIACVCSVIGILGMIWTF
jgi:hypothetical protein